MTMDDPVRRALAELADADAFRNAPPHLERAILDAFDRHRGQGWFQRCAATLWAYRREGVAVAAALGMITTLYFTGLDRIPVRPRGPERSVQLSVSRSEVPPMPEPVEAQEPRMVPPPAPHQAPQYPRTREDPPVESDVDQSVATWEMSDEGVHSVHVRVPRAYLPLLGVPIIDPDADGTVNLEVLVAEDGLVRTIHVGR